MTSRFTMPPGTIAAALKDHVDGTAACSESCVTAWKRTPPPVKTTLPDQRKLAAPGRLRTRQVAA